MIHDIMLALWVFVPAGLGNMAPVFAAKIPGLRDKEMPLDGGKTFRGRRIFGDHKTWRGLIAGMIISTLTLGFQQLLVAHFHWFSTVAPAVDYMHLPTLLVGPLFGLGALGGDAVESFFKRQVGVDPGKSWFPFDQLDYIIGGIILTLPFIRLTLHQYVWLIATWMVLHIVVNYIGDSIEKRKHTT